MTEPEARALLAERAKGFWNDTKRHFTVELGPNQAAAVVSMAYNKGANGMKRFAPDLLAAINQRRFDDAAELWKTSLVRSLATGVESGPPLGGLIRRRAKESVLFSTPHPSEAFMALTSEQQDQLLATTLATNAAVSRLRSRCGTPRAACRRRSTSSRRRWPSCSPGPERRGRGRRLGGVRLVTSTACNVLGL